MPGYQYRPVSYSESEGLDLRLVSVLPGRFDSDISCQMIYEKLRIGNTDNEDVLLFEALSYTWGDTSLPGREILLDETPFHVTTNLEEALRYLRWEDCPRLFWIDAICIDQSNIPERNEMVLHMRDIYKSAFGTAIWLGPDLPPNDLSEELARVAQLSRTDIMKTFELLRTLANTHREYRSLNEKKESTIMKGISTSHYEEFFNNSTLPVVSSLRIPTAEKEEYLLSLQALLTRPWFRRIWVLQEATVSKRAIVACGHHELRWEDMLLAMTSLALCVSRTDLEQYNLIPGLAQIFIFSRVDNHYRGLYPLCSPGFSLFTLLRLTSSFQATDPRDKIYAVLGLLRPNISQHIIDPDYEQSVDDVYAEASRRILLQSHTLTVLCLCGNRGSFGSGEDGFHGISWVPSLGAWKQGERLPVAIVESEFYDPNNDSPLATTLHAAGKTRCNVVLSEDQSVLTVEGYRQSQIETLCANFEQNQDLENFNTSKLERIMHVQKVLTSWESTVNANIDYPNPYGDKDSVHKALALLLLDGDIMAANGYEYECEYNPSQLYQDFMRFENVSQEIRPDWEIEDITSYHLTEANRFAQSVYDFAHSCRLFITSSQHLGLTVTSHEATLGHSVCILLGGPMPFILRETNTETRLIGRSLIQGMMKGEMMEEIELDGGKLELFSIH